MTWLVVGANGQLGRSVIEVLERKSIEFVAWNRQQGSISVENFVNSYIGAIKPEVVVNCAAWTDVDGAEGNETSSKLVNADAVGFLANASKSVGAIFVHVSTDYVFSGIANSPWEVNQSKQPLSAYGRTKAKGEDLIQDIFPDGSYIFRTAWLYSPYGKNFAKTMVKLALRNEENISVVDDQLGQPTSASDLAEQIVTSIEIGLKPGIFHATNSGEATWNDFAKEIFRLIGEDLERVQPMKSSELNRPAPRPAYSVLSHACWENSGVKPMRDWRLALTDQIDEIKAAVIVEGIQ